MNILRNFSKSDRFIEKIKTNTVLNVPLYLCIFMTPLLILGMIFSDGWKPIFFAIILFIIILFILFWYSRFAKTDPDRLHTEEHIRACSALAIEASKNERKYGQFDLSPPTNNGTIPVKIQGENLYIEDSTNSKSLEKGDN